MQMLLPHAHHWMLRPDNKGTCKYCGARHDFTEDNKFAFPDDYAKGAAYGYNLKRNYVINHGFVTQGRLAGVKVVELD